jgi:hypothetical protein
VKWISSTIARAERMSYDGHMIIRLAAVLPNYLKLLHLIFTMAFEHVQCLLNQMLEPLPSRSMAECH